MIEAEVKLAVDRDKIREGLEALGFMFRDEVRETDIYFDGEAHRIAEKGEALRLREQLNITTGEKLSYITFKGKKIDDITMTRQELETEVDDISIMKSIFEAIGLKGVFPVIKTRHSYVLDEITACLDSVENLGDFLELEILLENENSYDTAIEKLSEVLESLGYSIEDTITTSYLTMLQSKIEGRELHDI